MAEAMGRYHTVMILAALMSASLALGTATALAEDTKAPTTPVALGLDILQEDGTDAATHAETSNPEAHTEASLTDEVQTTARTTLHEADATVEATVGDILDAQQVEETLTLVDQLPVDPINAPALIGFILVDEEDALEDPREPPKDHAVFTEQAPDSSTGLTPLAIALMLTPAATAAAAGAAHAGTPWLRRLLAGAPLTPFYSRITRSDVLDHDTRKRLYDALKAEPGLSIRTLAERLDVSRSTARHHVRMLQDADMVDAFMLGRCRVHHVTGDKQAAMRRHVLRNENRARIAAAIQEGERSISEIADAVDANVGSVHFHLEKLCEAGLAKRRENGRVTYKAGALEGSKRPA